MPWETPVDWASVRDRFDGHVGLARAGWSWTTVRQVAPSGAHPLCARIVRGPRPKLKVKTLLPAISRNIVRSPPLPPSLVSPHRRRAPCYRSASQCKGAAKAWALDAARDPRRSTGSQAGSYRLTP
jgi:hypothetical protein